MRDCRPADVPGRWQCTWLIQNQAALPLLIDEAWLPHGRFRGERRMPLALEIGSGGSASLELPVKAAEPSGTSVENAFLVLRARYADAAWRVFVRMRIDFDPTPRPRCELVTYTQARALDP